MKSVIHKLNKALHMNLKDAWNRFLYAYLYLWIDKIGMKLFGLLFHGKLKDTIILESHNDFDSNGGAFYEYLLKNNYNKKYKIVWFLTNVKPRNLPKNVVGVSLKRPSIKRWYYYNTSKYILCCHHMLGSIRKDQLSIYLTHGGFFIKSVKGNINIPRNITNVLLSSANFEKLVAEQYSMEFPTIRMKVLGFPSHDTFYQKDSGDLSKITNIKYSKVILWMPTFRQNKYGRSDSEKLSLGIPIIKNLDEYENLNSYLFSLDILLIIKIHPMQDISKISIENKSNILILNGEDVKKFNIDNYRLMKDADALISDYSSAAFEYMHLNRPIAYSIDDVENYKIGFIVNEPKTLMVGPLLECYKDLIEFIDSIKTDQDMFLEKRKLLFNKIFEYHDGKSSERLAKFMGLESISEK